MPFLGCPVLERAVTTELEVRIVGLDFQPRACGREEGGVSPAVDVNLKAIVTDTTGVRLYSHVGELAYVDCGKAQWETGWCEVGTAKLVDFGGLRPDLEPVPEVKGVEASDNRVGAPVIRDRKREGRKRAFGGVWEVSRWEERGRLNYLAQWRGDI